MRGWPEKTDAGLGVLASTFVEDARAVAMFAFGGKADIEAKLLTPNEARRIAANYCKTAGAAA
jgi:hypothetical protein